MEECWIDTNDWLFDTKVKARRRYSRKRLILNWETSIKVILLILKWIKGESLYLQKKLTEVGEESRNTYQLVKYKFKYTLTLAN